MLLVITLIPFSFSAIYTASFSYKFLQAEINNNLLSTCQANQTKVIKYLESAKTNTSSLAYAITREFSIHKDPLEIFQHYRVIFPAFMKNFQYDNLLLFNVDGKIIYQYSTDQQNGNTTNRQYYHPNLNKFFNEVKQAKKTIILNFEPAISNHGKQLIFVISPILINGKVQYIVASEISLQSLINKIWKIPFMQGIEKIFLLGKNYQILATLPKNITVKKGELQKLKQFINSYEMHEIKPLENFMGKNMLASYASVNIDDLHMILFTTVDKAVFMGPIYKFLSIISLLGIILIIAIALISFFLANGFVKPLRNCVAIVNKISEGDFTEEIQIDRNDELGSLMKSLYSMIHKLNICFIKFKRTSEEINNGSKITATTSTELSQAATESATSIKEIAASIEEIATTIKANVNNAKETEEIANQAATEAQKGGEIVEQTVEAMKQVAEKISIIEDIAQKINLLALNASIEAARAGEHGKGFTIVAEEVRELAARSSSAAKEIKDLSTSSVEVAIQAGDVINKIVPMVTRTAELIQQVATANSEQNIGVSEISNVMQQMEQVTRQTASASEKLHATAENMLKQAHQFEEIIKQYNTSNKHIDTNNKHIDTKQSTTKKE
jgi:methyl-accepting chemotaxis protein